MYYFPTRQDFTPLRRALRETERLLGGLSRWSREPPNISDRERALLQRGVLTGETSLPKLAGSGGLSTSKQGDAPRPTSEE